MCKLLILKSPVGFDPDPRLHHLPLTHLYATTPTAPAHKSAQTLCRTAHSCQIPQHTQPPPAPVPYRDIITGLHGQGIQHVFVEQAGPFSRVPQTKAAEIDFACLKSYLA